jgi:C1A family cysteine protease
MPRKIKGYGWIPDLPDQRDRRFAAPEEVLQALPSSVDLRPQCPKVVYNQGSLGSCTANAIAGALEFDQIKEGLPQVFTPSRLFIYYNERAMEGTVDSDSGAQIRDGISSVAKQGAPPESLWPYDIAQFAEQPPPQAYQAALQNKALLYMRLDRDLNQFKGCLASGYPFVLGMTVYESFEGPQVARTGHVPMPGYGEGVVGGHAVLAVGYDDGQQWFLVRNSWGPDWGMGGYFTLPYAYLAQPNISSDFWTIRVVQ